MPPKVEGASVRVGAFLYRLGLNTHAEMNALVLERKAFLNPWVKFRDECYHKLECMKNPASNTLLEKYIVEKTFWCLERTGAAIPIKGDEAEPFLSRLYAVQFLFEYVTNMKKPGEYLHGKTVTEDLVKQLYHFLKLLCANYRQGLFHIIHVIERKRPSTMRDYSEGVRAVRPASQKPAKPHVPPSGDAEDIMTGIRGFQRAEGAKKNQAAEASKPKGVSKSRAPVKKVVRVEDVLKNPTTALELPKRLAPITFSVDGGEIEAPIRRQKKEEEMVYPSFDYFQTRVVKVADEMKKAEEDEDEESLFIPDPNQVSSSEDEADMASDQENSQMAM